MSRIVVCSYCHNEFNFKHVGKIYTISYHKRRYIVKECPKCQGLIKYRKGEIYKLKDWY
jgi:NAD-dependent SIR2 family protein deacetylase